MKKIFAILIILLLVMVALQMFGGRDFTQVPTAVEKYQLNGDAGAFVKDMGTIFKGKEISEGGMAVQQMAERLIYKWKDESGVIKFSERMPDVKNFEVIRVGDLHMTTQESLSQEEIDRLLKKSKK